MRISLVHNPDAGGRSYTSDDLVRLLRNAGHEVASFAKDSEGIARALDRTPQIMVAAGGDGTVAKAAIALCDHEVPTPLYVVPLGTANNIARALGVRDTAPVLAEELAHARLVSLDVAAAEAPWGSVRFVESAGLGFFGGTLRRYESLRARIGRMVRSLRRRAVAGEAEVRGAARGLARTIRRWPARRYQVVADGQDRSGEYLAVEAMNIRSVGPRLALAPDADHRDGLLDLVLIRESDRESLARQVESLGVDFAPSWERHRVAEAQLFWHPKEGHTDDAPWPPHADREHPVDDARVRVAVAGAVQVLVPRPVGERR
jgi:diacylglycerol kinase (ATP)